MSIFKTSPDRYQIAGIERPAPQRSSLRRLPQYHLPELPQLNTQRAPVQRGRRGRQRRRETVVGGQWSVVRKENREKELATPVRSSGPTPGESSFGGPLSGIQRGTAGQAKSAKKLEGL